MILSAVRTRLGERSRSHAQLERLFVQGRLFAADPVGEVNRYFLTEEVAEGYLEALNEAGLEGAAPVMRGTMP